MNSTGFLSLSEAAERLDVGKEQVRRYVHRGLLPATKLANIWVVPSSHVAALKTGRPSDGRPLSPRNAWSCIVDNDINLDDSHRYSNRGVLTRWAGTPGAIADLMLRSDIVVSGIHAAHLYGALLPPIPDETQIYVEQSTTTDVMDGFAADPLGRVTVRTVDSENWRTLQEASKPPRNRRDKSIPVTALCAPPAAVALDLVLSQHPRERYVADKIMHP